PIHTQQRIPLPLLSLYPPFGISPPPPTPSPANLPQQLIIVQTSGNYNQQEAANMIQRINNIDSKTLYALYHKNIRIKLINFPITYLPEYS
ncbi:anthrax toxin lethal factor-related metalloendopeptidase, partial [Escherichia sp. R-CC3]